jgi:hypothetical protein
MNERKLIVSFGSGAPLPGNKQLATITAVSEDTWDAFATLLTTNPPETEDKASRGWYCPAEFSVRHRHGTKLLTRHALTLDYDVIQPNDLKTIQQAFAPFAYAIYTTWSHTADKPRVRVVMPTSRPMSADEFCAISRKIADRADIELTARESHKPAQMMFQPTRKPGAKFFGRVNKAPWIDVDAVLAEYADWKDRASWPKHKVGDEQYSSEELPPLPNTKPGIVGDFCRAFDVPAAIEKFELPYERTANPNRYTYTDGSRPEGAILYDDGQKLHSHHDSDPANGQHNAYDLVRLHKFGAADDGFSGSIADAPSSKLMGEFARKLPEVQQGIADEEFEALPEVPAELSEGAATRFRVIPANEFAVGSPLAWIIKSVLPRAELVVLYGESGAGKSFLAFDLCAAVSRGVAWQEFKTTPGRVVYVCAEGAGGFRNRINAYALEHEVDLSTLPAVVADAPNLVEVDDVLDLTRAICEKGKADLVVIDTLAASTPGADENSGQDMGKVLSHCKAMHKATGALIVLIHHSGKDATKGARGWSGLKAAADAQIQVTREGDFRTVKIEKMKDGSDGKEWTFKLSPVLLGMDEDGDEITSCVIEFVEPPVQQQSTEGGLGVRQRTVLNLVRDMEAERGDCYVSDLLDEAVKLMPHDTSVKRDYRRQHARTAMQALLDKKFLFLRGADRISATNAVQATTVEFDEKAKA